MGRNNSRIRGTKKKRTRKKKGGNSYEKGETCQICFVNPALSMYCAHGHYFCSVCIEEMLRRASVRARGCPVCSGEYEPEEPIDIKNTEYGQYREFKGYVDAPVDVGLVKEYIYGDCCTECKKSMCSTVFCGKASCRGCKKNSAEKIIGIYDEERYCKKEGFGKKKSNGGGKKKRRRRGTKKRAYKKRRKRNLKKRTRRRRRKSKRRRRR